MNCRNGLISAFRDGVMVVFFFDFDRVIVDRELQGPEVMLMKTLVTCPCFLVNCMYLSIHNILQDGFKNVKEDTMKL